MVIRDQRQNLEEKLDAVINDPVNHPSHYTSSKIEVIEYILDHGFDYLLGNVVKYISRAGLKSKDTEIQDLEKAQWYLNRKIEELKAVTYCQDCRKTYPTMEFKKVCPYCHSENTFLLTGNEYNIKEIEAM